MTNFTFIDLFCGIGGFRQALTALGGTCVFSSDKSKNAQKTYFFNYGEKPAGDITKIQAKDIPAFDVLCAGFPCQPFSRAGKQRGFSDPRGTMFFEIVRIAEYHKPKVLFLENVANLSKHDNGNTLNVILDSLDRLGYRVYYKILAANEYGVAQTRKRIYFVCFRKDLTIDFEFPEPTFADIAVEDFITSDIPEGYFIDPGIVTFYKADTTERTLNTYRLGYIDYPGQGRRIYSIKGCMPTLVRTSRGPCSATEAYCINGRVRKLTPDEVKCIMGFPEDFILPDNTRAALEQLGNSVAIPVLKAIAKEIIATDVFEETPS